MMLGFKINPWMKISWLILTPVFTMTIFILGAVSYSELEYKRKTLTYQYPDWAIGIGWCMCVISVIWIPIIVIKRMVQAKGSIAARFFATTKPRLRRHQLRQGEDLSKVNIVDDDREETLTPTPDEAPPSYNSVLLSNSIDIAKMQNVQSGDVNV